MRTAIVVIVALAGCAASNAELATEATAAREARYDLSTDAALEIVRDVIAERYGLADGAIEGGIVRSSKQCRTKAGDWCRQVLTADYGSRVGDDGTSGHWFDVYVRADVRADGTGTRVEVSGSLIGWGYKDGDELPGWLKREIDATQIAIDRKLAAAR
jgi:hypothetical protein